VLSHVLFEPQEGGLLLAASDLEVFITATVGAKVDGDESGLTVPARLFTDLVNSLPTERIDLTVDTVDAVQVHLACGKNEADVKGIGADEFPMLPEAPEQALALLDPDLLREMIGQVAYAAASDESRPILTGVYTKFEGETLTMAAADGFRLAVREAKLDEPIREPISVVIPAKALTELARISGEEEEPIGLYVNGARSQILFRLQANAGANKGRIFGIDLTSQLIEGNFVNYKQIIPQSHSTRVTLDRQSLIKACRTAAIFARTEANTVNLAISDSGVVLSSVSTEMGDYETALEATVEGEAVGEAMDIRFNVNFVLEAVGAMDSAQVAVELNAGSAPGTFKPVGSEDYVVVIMPMHVRS